MITANFPPLIIPPKKNRVNKVPRSVFLQNKIISSIFFVLFLFGLIFVLDNISATGDVLSISVEDRISCTIQLRVKKLNAQLLNKDEDEVVLS